MSASLEAGPQVLSIPSAVLAAAISYVVSLYSHRWFGTVFGSLIDLAAFIAVFYYAHRTLRRIRDE